MTTGNNLPKVKQLNDELIKTILFKFGPISRLEIANLLSLTPPTITTNVGKLIKAKLVVEEQDSRINASPGRPPVALKFQASALYFFGIEKAAYHTPIVLCNLAGEVVLKRSISNQFESYGDFLAKIRDTVKEMITQSKIPLKKIMGIGIGSPGRCDKTQRILLHGAFSQWSNKNVAQDLEDLVHLPVVIDNNVRVRAIAKDLKTPSMESESFAYFFVSRGVSCPLVSRSYSHGSISVSGGEAGHMVIDPTGPVCSICGNHGCLDAIACEATILKECEKVLQAGTAPILKEILGERNLTMAEVIEAEARGDEKVISIIKSSIYFLGIAAANMANLFSPQTVYVDALLLNTVENQELFSRIAESHIFEYRQDEMKIEFIPFDPYLGAQSAALFACKKFFIQKKLSPKIQAQ
jgi:predicted NBD/HSP70 family sugar kinase